jgi:hypothetical protein
MELSTWAKCKLEENWLTSLFKAIMKMEGFSNVGRGEKSTFKRKKNSFTRRHAMKDNGINGKTPQKGKSPKKFKAQVSNPKELSLRKGFL